MTSTANAVAERQAQTPANVEQHPASQSQALMLMAERLATNPDADVSKLKQILDIAREARAEEAEQALNNAMTDCQTEMQPIRADAKNPSTKSKYASFPALDEALRPIYTKHGFALSFNTGKAEHENEVLVLCYLTHRAGGKRMYELPMPADGKGAKGNDVMTRTHATGSAITYGQRYLLGMVFNIAVTGKRDDDGNAAAATTGPITETQVKELQKQIEETKGDIVAFCEHFKIEALPELNSKDYQTALTIIANRRSKMGAKK